MINGRKSIEYVTDFCLFVCEFMCICAQKKRKKTNQATTEKKRKKEEYCNATREKKMYVCVCVCL